MRRVSLLFVVTAAISALPAGGSQELPVVQFVEAGKPEQALELREEPASYDRASGSELAGTEIVAQCSGTRIRGIDVQLRWQVAAEQPEVHRVDLSMFRDGFAKGRYLTSGKRPAAEPGLVFADALPGVYYYWRLLTQKPEGWVVSAAGRFDSPICPVDEVFE